jgi:glycosyltransferase involved in cell wall biosynthesis
MPEKESMQNMNKNLVVVLGMHRSGTSALTRSLHVLGVGLGDNLMPSLEGNNAKGFYEDLDLNKLNIDMLKALGSEWDHLTPIDDLDIDRLRRKGFFLRAIDLIRSKVEASSVFGFKDPRVAMLLPFWKQVFAHCEYDVKYVLAVRNPMSVAKSLRERDGFDSARSYLLWLGHVLTSLQFSAGATRIMVDYDNLMQSPDREIDRLSVALGLEINPQELEVYKAEFLDSSLRHTVHQLADLMQDDASPPLVREVYRVLIEICEDRLSLDAPSLQADLEAWLVEFHRTRPTLKLVDRLYTQVGKLKESAVLQDDKIADLAADINAYEQKVATFDQAIANQNERILDLSARAAKQKEQIADLHGELSTILQSRSWRLTAPLRTVPQAVMSRFVQPALRPGRAAAKKIRQLTQRFRQAKTSENIQLEAETIARSGLFDEVFYLSSYPDLTISPGSAIKHYCEKGWREGRSPSRDFDTQYYLSRYPDVAEGSINPLLHFIEHGRDEGRQAAAHAQARVSASPKSIGRFAGEIETIKQSGLFDPAYYLSTNPDLDLSPEDTVRHYCMQGWQEGRNPSNEFDTRFYLANYRDIREAGLNPFWHYVTAGAKELRHSLPEVEVIIRSGLFDENYYRAMYPELELAAGDAIPHFCELGWREGRNPSDDFDTNFYLRTHIDIRDSGENPFWHYVVAGARELRRCLPDPALRYEEDISFGDIETDLKLLAYYAAPNWDTLRAARPRFKGHAQPVRPDEELGYYSYESSDVLIRHAKMAKSHGLFGFCFDLHIDAKAELPRQPLDCFLEDGAIDFRFCTKLTLNEDFVSETATATLAPIVSDPRYIRVDSRPLLLIEANEQTPKIRQLVNEIRLHLSEMGVGNPYVVARSGISSAEDQISAKLLMEACDGILDLPLVPVPAETSSFEPVELNGVATVPYSVVSKLGVDRSAKIIGADFPIYNAITLGRDSTASVSDKPLVYTQFHIRKYRRWLDAAIDNTRAQHEYDRRFVFINAWNDWNNGLFLEPDKVGGFARLNETSRALLGIESGLRMPKVSVVVPNYNHEVFLRRRLDSIYRQTYKNIEVILLDDASQDRSREILDEYASRYAEFTRTIYNATNSGGAFRQWAKGIKASSGELIWIAESDDFCYDRFLEVLVRCFDDEAVLLAYGKSEFVDRNEAPIKYGFRDYLSGLSSPDRWNDAYVATAHQEVSTTLGVKNTIPNSSSALFRRPVEMPLLDDEAWLSMRVAGDWVFYLHILRGGKIAFAPDAINFFRRYEGSTAETTYEKEIFYREVGMASRTVAALYNVPIEVLEQCRKGYEAFYWSRVGRSETEFSDWYNFDAVLQSREDRAPNLVVATMGFYPGGAEILPIRMANEFKRQGMSVLMLNAGLHQTEDGIRRMLRHDIPVVETSDVAEAKAVIQSFGIEALNTHQWHVQKYPLTTPDVFDDLYTHVASLHGMIEHGGAFETTTDELVGADQSVTTWIYTADKNVTPFLEAGVFDVRAPRFVKIPNGMEPPAVTAVPRSELGIPDDAFVLCCVSRGIPEKGWAEAIASVQRARQMSGLDIRLILVGNGYVYDLYCKTGVPDFVYLAGFSEDSVGHYAAADMGIMLTKFRSESFPLTIVDCLFAGRPFIGSDVGEIKNMLTVGDGMAGAVVPLNDWEVSIEQAADTIMAFASNAEKYSTAAAVVSQAASRYRIDVVASQYISLFESGHDGRRIGERKAAGSASQTGVDRVRAPTSSE